MKIWVDNIDPLNKSGEKRLKGSPWLVLRREFYKERNQKK